MSQPDSDSDRETREFTVPAPPPPSTEPALVDAHEFEAAFGEPLARALDLDTWQPGENLAALYGRLEQEIEQAVRQENRIRERIREEVFPRLRTRVGAPPGAGVYQARVDDVERVHRGLLFNGAVEACDGTSVVHDTLPVTIAQIGVCLVSYRGDQGSWVQRLYRRDLRVGGLDPVEEALEVLERRQQRAGFDMSSKRDSLSDLGRRGIMTYAERAVLLRKSDAPWRMGHGNPTPYELITGSGMRELLENSLDLLDELVEGHRRFVFVPSAPGARALLTISNALQPLEFAIVDTITGWLERIVEQGHYRGDWAALLPRVKQFISGVGPQVVVGLYRASDMAPAQLFYAHVEHAHEAALIAIADSALQEHRGFPMLIDLADTVCRATFGTDSFTASTQLAYVEAGEPFRYLTERQTRR
ncbi:MAG TPA: hypothetical protein VNL15_07635 [Dehalococcoidia bacterium]|nr:hypothetical protein [Dehalococcoidia bacterium]